MDGRDHGASARPSASGGRARPRLAAAAALAVVVVVYAVVPGDGAAADALRSCLCAVAVCALWAAWGERPRLPWRARPARTCSGAPADPARPASADPARPASAAPARAARRLMAALVAALVAYSAVPALAAGVAAASSSPGPEGGVGGVQVAVVVLSCLGTAVWEEGLFRWLGPRALSRGLAGRRDPFQAAVAVSAALFALVHVSAAAAPDVSGGGVAGWAVPAMRACQVFLFALCMSGLAGRDGAGMVGSMALHAAFDLACLLPALAAQGAPAPAASLLAYVQDLRALAASLPPLLLAGALSVSLLARDSSGGGVSPGRPPR